MISFIQYLTELNIKIKPKNPNVQHFMNDLHATTAAHPFSDRERIVNNNATVHVSPSGEGVHLHDIRSLHPKSGAGTAALKHLTGLADKHKVKISGVAKAYHGDKKYISSSKKLSSWYEKHGFKKGHGSNSEGYSIDYHPKP